MTKESQTSQIIRKYLENKCSINELETIGNLFQNRENDDQIKETLYSYWANTPSFHDKVEKNELNEMLHFIHNTIDKTTENKKSTFKVISFYAVRIAAALFIPLLIASAWLFTQNNIYTNDNSLITLETPMGSKLKTTLPDGTEVWQNAGTTLQYPNKFTKKNREVILTGEAYFHVKSDKKNPFYVKTDDGTIKVTGTRFNVCSFSDDEFSSVVLEEGKLSFIPANEKSKTYKLLPEDQLLVLEETGEVIQRKTDVQKHIAWTNGKLIFRNDPLSEVITRLNRWYNADITLDDPNNELGEHPFTLTIHNETLPQVIEFITQAADLHATKINADGPIDGILQKSKYIIN